MQINRKNIFNKFLSSTLIFALVAVFFNFSVDQVDASAFTAMKDTMTRLKISTTADHTIVLTLPTGIGFDRAGGTDILRYDFGSFTTAGTWVVGDFTFNDGTARTVQDIVQGTTPGAFGACTDGANTVGVKVDTDDYIFTVTPCGASFVGSSTAATVTFTIDGTSADGTFTNPGSAGSSTLSLSMDDEGSGSAHSGSIALGIADDDQVTVTASVDSVLTFDLDTDSDGGTDEGVAPYTVAIGTITTTDTRVSGTTDAFAIIVAEADTNASSGVVVTVLNANGANGLVSTSVVADDIDSADGTMADGTENYGLCVATATLTGFSRAAPYNTDTCATNSETNGVQGLTTTGENILSTSGPVASAHAEIIVNAAISGITAGHSDYTDTLTFIATGTF